MPQRERRTRARWRTVLFSEQSRFLLAHADGRTCLYRRREKSYAPICVQQVFGGGKIETRSCSITSLRTSMVECFSMTMPDHMLHVLVENFCRPGLKPNGPSTNALDQRVCRRNPPPQTLLQLCTALQHKWRNILHRDVQHLIASMHRRCQAVIRARGGHNRY